MVCLYDFPGKNYQWKHKRNSQVRLIRIIQALVSLYVVSRKLQWTRGYPLDRRYTSPKNIYITKDNKFSHSYYSDETCCLTCKTVGATVYKLRGMCANSYLGRKINNYCLYTKFIQKTPIMQSWLMVILVSRGRRLK